MNISCVICSDLFVSVDNIFTTPCGHIFHHVCLIQWMERKKDCPQCRQKCTERNIFRVYFNNTVNLDSSSVNSANLIETVDNLTLKLRESEMALKSREHEKSKLEDTLHAKEKKIKKQESTISQSNQIIATMRHEIDLLSSSRASYKIIEAENVELKAKMALLQTVETVLSASQADIDDILKQNFSVKDLSVMVGSLRRELNCSEERKNVMRKQLQALKNELRAEQEQKKKLEELLSNYESRNHSLTNQLKKLESRLQANATKSNDNDSSVTIIPDETAMEIDSPDIGKKPRLALADIDDENTPSPSLSHDDFMKRIQQIQESDSPYFKLKSSSIGLSRVIQKPTHHKEQSKSTSTDSTKLSIFQKPRLAGLSSNQGKSEAVYNGLGATAKVLQSDLKTASKGLDSFWTATASSKPSSKTFKKKLSANAFGK